MLTPDVAQARAFLARLDPEADAFTLQTFDDTAAKRTRAARVHQVAVANGALEELGSWNRHGAGVFVTVNRTDGTGRQTHNVLHVRALFVDLDGAELGPILSAPLSPHIVVESSRGRYHAYWLCDDCPLDVFPQAQRALAAKFAGDPTVHDLPRVMRLPGFLHNKGEPFLTHELPAVGFDGPPYAFAEIVATLGLDLHSAATTRPTAPPADSEKIGQGGRHAYLFASGRSMAKRGLTSEAVRAALAAENQARCDPPLPDGEIASLAARAFTAKDAPSWDAAKRTAERASAPDASEGHPGTTDAPAGDSGGPAWPAALDPAAFHGIAGEFVQMVEPNTEADPAAILLQFLAAFGALIGRGPHYRVEGDEHHANLYVLLVGATAKGRKGTSWGRVREVFERVTDWKPHVSGLSSGEGVKYHVRDACEETKSNKNGELVTSITDEGVADKRLFVVESEFASVLRAVQRQGNTLSATIREGWDSGNLRSLTKNDPITATGAHISIVGHVTDDELRAELTATDTANGFANRFLFVGVKRSKLLPHGGDRADESEAQAFADRLRERAATARTRHRVTMTREASAVWEKVYSELSAGSGGLHGAVTARAEAQTTRLALLYCLLDGADQIETPHLLAALAVWQYCDATARYVFGASLGDRIADDLMRRIERAGDAGLTRTEMRDALGRHQTADRIGAALEMLRAKGRAACETVNTGGRPVELWRATK